MRSTLADLIAYLGDALSVPVSMEVPRERPAAFVAVDPVGGTPSLDALHHDYALQAWSESNADAEALVREVCDAMRGYGATPLASPVPLGRDATHFWWQATYTVHALW